MSRRIAAIALAATLAGSAVAAAEEKVPAPPDGPELARRIDAYVRPFVQAGDLSGTLLVARGDAVVYEHSFGMASYELEVPNTPTTLFCVASVSTSWRQ